MKKIGRIRRHKRITKKVKGTSQRPRLVIFRSKKHFYSQIVNDAECRVIAGVSSLTKDFQSKKIKASDKDGAKAVGKMVAEKAVGLGVKQVSFDRAGYKYHGRVKAFSDGAREGGLKF
ncbi:MAG: 50S ribosomal protein L18 [Candidatus Omnitrophica bacterium]|nr:50S ribosomal protein L18 [Candidatus Omnitrophota bacterium]